MAMVAYSPIARGNAKNDKLLARIGAAHKKTAAQICLRYLVQQDIVVIPRTSKLERLSENAALFDFALERRRNGRDRRTGAPRRPDRRLVLFRNHEVGLEPSGHAARLSAATVRVMNSAKTRAISGS